MRESTIFYTVEFLGRTVITIVILIFFFIAYQELMEMDKQSNPLKYKKVEDLGYRLEGME